MLNPKDFVGRPKYLILEFLFFLAVFLMFMFLYGGLTTTIQDIFRPRPDHPEGTAINLESFRKIAREAACADQSNRLLLIDDTMIFWDRQGNCPDNRYSFTLFGKTPEETLCSRADSIVGPRESCPKEGYQEIFQTILNNLDDPNLGLSPTHQVEQIF